MGASQSELANFVDPGPPVTDERIKRALKSYEGATEVVLRKMEDSSADVKGENFMGTLAFLEIEATVDGVDKHYDWIVKSTPREPNRAAWSSKLRADEREVAFFKEVLPNIKKFLKSLDRESLLPNLCEIPYASWSEEDKILMMQNLKKIGWQDAINKKKGLDIEHARLAFNWLATFHAINYCFVHQYSGGSRMAKKELEIFFMRWKKIIEDMGPNMDVMRDMGNDQMKGLFKTLETEGTNYVETFDKFLENNLDIGTSAMELKERPDFHVETILHGDPWFNNMLFKYNEEHMVEDVVFIDFQMMCFGSPTDDLTYFLSSSVTGDLMKKYKDHLLTLYHTKFCSLVELLGSKVEWSYEEFLEDYKKSALWGLQFALQTLPQILTENKEKIMDMEEAMAVFNTDENVNEKKELMDDMYATNKDTISKTEGLVERLRYFVDECIEMGAL